MMIGSLWRVFPVLLSLAVLRVDASEGKVASAWYAGWHSTTGFPLSKVSWSKYTHLTYAFAETTPNVQTLNLSGSNPSLLPQFVQEAHKNGVKALVSIGGWTGSRSFSTNVGSAGNRTAFVGTVTKFAKQYNLDGLDFDWEYPGKQGIGCNAVNKDDSQNFLLFLQELRKDSLGQKLILSAATSILPFTGPNGSPLEDVSGFAEVLDFIEIMDYDVWGSWSATVGPNAPLNDTCAAPQNRVGSAVSAVLNWQKAGIPFNKIVLGVASYGHSFRVYKADAFVAGSTTVLTSYPKFDAKNQPAGDCWDGGSGVDECGNTVSAGGIVDFWGLIELGYLNANGTPKQGIFYRYDDCSQTPYVYNSQSQVMISFDNAESFAAKGKYIRDIQLKGFSMWEAGSDSNDILLNSIRAAGGY